MTQILPERFGPQFQFSSPLLWVSSLAAIICRDTKLINRRTELLGPSEQQLGLRDFHQRSLSLLGGWSIFFSYYKLEGIHHCELGPVPFVILGSNCRQGKWFNRIFREDAI